MRIPRLLLVTLLIVGVFFLGMLFFSEAGLRLIGRSITRHSGGAMSVGEMQGRLSDEFVLGDIRFGFSGMEISIDKITWRWRPARLLLGEFYLGALAVEGVEVALSADSADTPPPNKSLVLPVSLIPFSLVLENFLVDGLKISGGDGSPLVQIDSIAARLEGNSEGLTFDSFSVEGPDIGLAVHGRVEADRQWSVDLMGSWYLAGFGFHPLKGTFSVLGPLESPHLELGVNSSGVIRAAIDATGLLKKPQWTGTLEASDVDLSALILDCPQILLSTVSGQLSGDLDHYRGLVKANGSWDTLKGMNLVGQISGDGMGIDFQSLRIGKGDIVAEAEGGKINWREIFGWEGRFFLQNFDPSVITESLPGKITSNFFSIGEVKENGVVASFEIAKLDGILRGQAVSASGNIFLTENDVHTDGLTIQSGEMEGVAHVDRAMFAWSERPSWSGKVVLKNFNPAVLHPEFHGAINAVVSGAGSLGDRGPEGILEIGDISGNLRGNELSGGGGIHLSGDRFSTTGLMLKSGKSELTLRGRAGDEFGVDFLFSSPEISAIMPDASGLVNVTGSLTGNRLSPRLVMHIKGGGLHYRTASIDQLRVNLQAELKREGKVTGEIRGTSLGISGVKITEAAVDISGSLQEHQVAVTVDSPELQLKGRVRGRYDDHWQGTLSLFTLQSAAHGTWQQQRSAEITVGNDIAIQNFCIASGEGIACADGSFHPGEDLHWTVNTDVKSLPLNIINSLNPSPLLMDGLVSGEARGAGDEAGVTFAKISMAVPSVSFSLHTGEVDISSFHLNDFLLAADLRDGMLNAHMVTQPETGGKILLEAETEQAGGFSTSFLHLPLSGRFTATAIDLDLIDAFAGYGIELSGLLNSTFTFGGTVEAPILEGTAAIENGGISLLQQGISLENVKLSLRTEGQRAKITCSARSGSGDLVAKGDVIYENEGIEGDIHLQGNNFLLVNLPEYVIWVAPDVQFLFNSDRGELKGRVEVPYGRITPEQMVGSIAVSEDVIFVNGPKEDNQLKERPFALDLDVTLGDDVRLEGFGLTSRLSGNLNVTTSRDDFFTGKGQLNLVDGTFSVYGRTLDIERGRVLFNGGPISNPGLDVRAQVRVSDQQAKGTGYTVGVDISGLVEDLQFTLFSDPYMEDTEILSLMIVGKSLAGSSEEENIVQSAASSLGLMGVSKLAKGLTAVLPVDDVHLEGVGRKENVSLVVGKRLSKDLYIGYDINMFNQVGQFRVRYDLKRGFSVETRSSSETTGADLFYSFER